MSYNKVDPTTGALTKIAGLVDDTDLKADIAEVQAVIPSDASASNKLVTESVTNPLFGNSSTDIGRAMRYFGSFDGRDDFANNVGRASVQYGGWCEITNPTTGKQWPITSDHSCIYMALNAELDLFSDPTDNLLWYRGRYEGTPLGWQILTPTSTVTSGSTAPITSGGVYDAIVKRYSTVSLYPSSLGLATGEVGLGDLCTAINTMIGSDCCIHFAWDSSSAIALNVNGTSVTLAGSVLQGHFEQMNASWKLSEGWFTDEEGNMYSFRCRTQSGSTPTVTIKKLSS